MNSKICSFSVGLDDDLDIIAWMDSLPRRQFSVIIRGIIREHLAGEGNRDKMIREIWERVMGYGVTLQKVDYIGGGEKLDLETLGNLKGLGQ